MVHEFPPDLQRELEEQMALGQYASETDLIRAALAALRERREDLVAIQTGLDDLAAEDVRPSAERS